MKNTKVDIKKLKQQKKLKEKALIGDVKVNKNGISK